MKKILLTALFCSLLVPVFPLHARENLESGIYLVTRKSTDQKKLEPLSRYEKLLVDDGRFLEPSERDPAEYIVLDTKQAVPFVLNGMFNEDVTPDKKPRLLLQFSPEQAKQLNNLTKNNIGKQIAVVVDSQIVSCHKIKEAISGGKLQISRCTKKSCELIYSKLLKKNIKMPN